MKRALSGATGSRELEEIIQTCHSIENRKFNPFLLDVSEALRILRRHYEHLNSLEDHLLDMRAITGVARVVGLQSAQLRFQSTSLFLDPEMAKRKLEGLGRQQLAEFLLLSWHPIIELEQLTPSTVKEAMEYWNQALSFFDRRRKLQLGPFAGPGEAEIGELTRAGLAEDRAFSKKLTEFWEELKEKAGPNSQIDYWRFVKGDQFAETVRRAQLVSFLVTYGYANMRRKGENILLSPREEPHLSTRGSPLSLPIRIPREV